MCLMCHAACKVEFQPFKRSYSQLTFSNFLLRSIKNILRITFRCQIHTLFLVCAAYSCAGGTQLGRGLFEVSGFALGFNASASKSSSSVTFKYKRFSSSPVPDKNISILSCNSTPDNITSHILATAVNSEGHDTDLRQANALL